MFLWLRLFLRFAVEERILRGGADGDGVHLAASVEQIEALGGQAGGEHDTGVDTMVGGGGAGGADGNAYIDAIDGAGHSLGALAAGGKTAMGAVEALGLFVGANEYDAFGAEDVVGIAKEELHAVFLAHGDHVVGQAADVFIGDEGHFDDVDAFPLGGGACGYHHLTGDGKHLFVAEGSFVLYHLEVFLSINDLKLLGYGVSNSISWPVTG